MLDRSVFVRPIAHRGLHDATAGIIENTATAFQAAITAGCGIECDLQAASDATPFVFHDAGLDRLTTTAGPFSTRSPMDLARVAYRGSPDKILAFTDMLDLVAGEVPLLVEIKNDFVQPSTDFLARILSAVQTYKGPLALMSFDPVVMAAVRDLAPAIPRGIVAGIYRETGWWSDRLDRPRAARLSDLLETAPAAPHFIAYHVRDLPTPVTRYVREVQGLALFTWTVRDTADRATAMQWADAPIFEGEIPSMPKG